ncbi:DUF7694 domain-containing protein [Williamsia sp.]|uniref:DUF7694 domain-containing protein n=1 Tax=Williamsia sp. TaxID=1872085 RepID=UPI002F9442B2
MNSRVTRPTQLDPLKIRNLLGRKEWHVPIAFGPAGWRFDSILHDARVLATISDLPDTAGVEWIHASISHPDTTPTYDELVLLHRAVFPGHAYQVFVPTDSHVNIHPYALHLFGRADGAAELPNFAPTGSI